MKFMNSLVFLILTMVNTDAGATKAPVMYRVNGTGAVNIKVEAKMLKYIH